MLYYIHPRASPLQELEVEKAALRGAQKELRREHAALLKDQAAKQARVSELAGKARDVQLLKFGREIDLELLDRVGASKGTEALREELKKQVWMTERGMRCCTPLLLCLCPGVWLEDAVWAGHHSTLTLT